jgi:hypothetical protein
LTLFNPLVQHLRFYFLLLLKKQHFRDPNSRWRILFLPEREDFLRFAVVAVFDLGSRRQIAFR